MRAYIADFAWQSLAVLETGYPSRKKKATLLRHHSGISLCLLNQLESIIHINVPSFIIARYACCSKPAVLRHWPATSGCICGQRKSWPALAGTVGSCVSNCDRSTTAYFTSLTIWFKTKSIRPYIVFGLMNHF